MITNFHPKNLTTIITNEKHNSIMAKTTNFQGVDQESTGCFFRSDQFLQQKLFMYII